MVNTKLRKLQDRFKGVRKTQNLPGPDNDANRSKLLEKIEEIKGRKSLTKTAKRKLKLLVSCLNGKVKPEKGGQDKVAGKKPDECSQGDSEVAEDGKQNKENGETSTSKEKKPKRYILHVINLPYNCEENDVREHFKNVGEIVSLRMVKGDTPGTCKGFAYLEFRDQKAFERAFSKHLTFIKGRQIKTEYTLFGKVKTQEQKTFIRRKNAKLHALRKMGKLEGSVKYTSKRCARRKKKQLANQENGSDIE